MVMKTKLSNDDEFERLKKRGKRLREASENDTYISPKKKKFLDYCDKEAERLRNRK